MGNPGQCEECGETIDTQLKVCPECGYNAPRTRAKKGVMIAFSGSLMSLTLIGGLLGVPLLLIGIWNVFKSRNTAATGEQINHHQDGN